MLNSQPIGKPTMLKASKRSAANVWARVFLAGAVWLSLPAGAHAAEQAPSGPSSPSHVTPGTEKADMTLDQFLDRLMMAESGGSVFARNTRSTAVGPYQFIASTWLQIAHKWFADEIEKLKPHQILALRTDIDMARRAAKIYTEENAAFLAANGHKPTFPHLRLAFLVGPGGAVRVLSAKEDALVSTLLGAHVIRANPFMSRLSAKGLIARAARDIAADPKTAAGVKPDPEALKAARVLPKKAAPKITVSCDLARPSCRRWLALATRKQARRIKRASRD